MLGRKGNLLGSNKGFTLAGVLTGVSLTLLSAWLTTKAYLSYSRAAAAMQAQFAADAQDAALLKQVESWVMERMDPSDYNEMTATSDNFSLSCTISPVTNRPSSATLSLYREAIRATNPTSPLTESAVFTTFCTPTPANFNVPQFPPVCPRSTCSITCGPNMRPVVQVTVTLADPSDWNVNSMTTSTFYYPAAPGAAITRSALLSGALCYSPIPNGPITAANTEIPLLTVESESGYLPANLNSPLPIYTRRSKTFSMVPTSGGVTQYVHEY